MTFGTGLGEEKVRVVDVWAPGDVEVESFFFFGGVYPLSLPLLLLLPEGCTFRPFGLF